MLKPFTIAAVAAALLAAGAYSPQAQVKSANTANSNITVVEKNQAWPVPGATADMCDWSRCQDV
jgi:hypothetical protein